MASAAACREGRGGKKKRVTFEAGITRDIFCCVIGPLPGAGKCVKVAPTGQERERGSGEEGEDFRWTRGRRERGRERRWQGVEGRAFVLRVSVSRRGPPQREPLTACHCGNTDSLRYPKAPCPRNEAVAGWGGPERVSATWGGGTKKENTEAE